MLPVALETLLPCVHRISAFFRYIMTYSLGLFDYATSGDGGMVAECLRRLGPAPSANMLANEGYLLVLGLRGGSEAVVNELWEHCKRHFLAMEGPFAPFDVMADTFFEVANDWEAVYKDNAALSDVMLAISQELNEMDKVRQMPYDDVSDPVTRSSGRSSDGLSKELVNGIEESSEDRGVTDQPSGCY